MYVYVNYLIVITIYTNNARKIYKMAQPIRLLKTKKDVREFCDSARKAGNKVGLVPTMGAIHSGHQSLVKRALEEAQIVVASVFVNPTQFSPTEDFDAYPRTIEADLMKMQEAGAAAVFAPSVEEMYGEAMVEHIRKKGLSSFDFASHAVAGSAARLWEGANRPHHFSGVTTVVSKLFNIVEPDIVCFGEKDYQQLAVLKQMVLDMDFNIKIVGCPIVREENGLAISSRNRYMDSLQTKRALTLSSTLRNAQEMYACGETSADKIVDAAIEQLKANNLDIDYVAIVDATTLEPLSDLSGILGKDARMIMAAKVDTVRLIDNAALG